MALFGNSLRASVGGKARELAFAGERELLPANPDLFGGTGSVAPAAREIQPGDFAAPRQVKPNFFGKGGMGWDIVGALADGFSVASGGRPLYWQMGQQQREWDREDTLYRRRLEDERNAPRFFSGASDYVMFDPRSGQTTKLYDAPTPAEAYAGSLGLEAGTPEYAEAMQDYVLRGMGPTAYENKVGFEGVRQENRLGMEQARQGNRVALEGVRQAARAALRTSPTYRDLNPAPSPSRVAGGIFGKMAAGKPLTAGEQKVIDSYGRGGFRSRRGSAASSSAPTATDPKTGRKVQWNGNAWVPVN